MSTTPATPLRRRPTTWLALGLLAIALGMVGFILSSFFFRETEELRAAARPDDVGEALAIVTGFLTMATLVVAGAVLAMLRPRNPIGWLLLVAGIGVVAAVFGGLYVEWSLAVDGDFPGHRTIDWLWSPMQSLAFALLIIWVPLLFPDGHLPSRRWRPFASILAAVLVAAFVLEVLAARENEFSRVLPGPIAIDAETTDALRFLLDLTGAAIVVFFPLVFVSVILRFRRSRGAERQQMKWFLAAASLVIISAVLMSATWALGDETLGSLMFYAFFATLAFLPIAIGIAVLRYRLYEIDRIISRTIGWAIVTGLLVGTFVLLVVVSSALLEPLTGGDTLAVAVSTLAAAALFAPLRRRVQRAVDRRFDRTRYDGERLLDGLGERLRDEVDLEAIRADVLGTVDAAVRPASVGLWLRSPGGGR